MPNRMPTFGPPLETVRSQEVLDPGQLPGGGGGIPGAALAQLRAEFASLPRSPRERGAAEAVVTVSVSAGRPAEPGAPGGKEGREVPRQSGGDGPHTAASEAAAVSAREEELRKAHSQTKAKLRRARKVGGWAFACVCRACAAHSMHHRQCSGLRAVACLPATSKQLPPCCLRHAMLKAPTATAPTATAYRPPCTSGQVLSKLQAAAEAAFKAASDTERLRISEREQAISAVRKLQVCGVLGRFFGGSCRRPGGGARRVAGVQTGAPKHGPCRW
jgi:hypothetical protein